MNRFLVAAVAACTLLVGPGIASADQLIEAAERGDVELVRQLIDGGADLNEQGRSGTALHRALARRHVDVVALLVARGATSTSRTRCSAHRCTWLPGPEKRPWCSC